MANFESGWTNAYVGSPFKDRGRDRYGWDCWGLVRVAYEEQLGISLPTLLGSYISTNKMDQIQSLISKQKNDWSEVTEQREGDVVTLRIMGRETHLGLVASDGKMLHVMEGTDTCLQPLTSAIWTRRVIGYFRHAEAV